MDYHAAARIHHEAKAQAYKAMRMHRKASSHSQRAAVHAHFGTPQPPDDFRFLYYTDWKEGMNVQFKKGGNVVEMGTLLRKELTGNPRDPDVALTLSHGGVSTVHMGDFGATYRQYQNSIN